MTIEKELNMIGHKIEELCTRFDTMEESHGYLIKLLESIVEAIPQGGRPNVMKAMEPLLKSPLIAGNPALAGMIKQFTDNMTGGGE